MPSENLTAKEKWLQFNWEMVPCALFRMKEITASAKLVMGFLMGRVRKGGKGACFPGIETIALNTGLGEATVKRAIAELAEVRDPRRGEGPAPDPEANEEAMLKYRRVGFQGVNHYEICFPAWIGEMYGDEDEFRSAKGIKMIPHTDQNDPSFVSKRSPIGLNLIPEVYKLTDKVTPEDQHGASRIALSDAPQTGETAGGGIASDGKQDAVEGSISPPAGPPKSAGAGSGLTIPGEDSAPRRGEKRPKSRSLYDPGRPIEGWNGKDAVGYFLHRFRGMWPGEGAPDWTPKDIKMAGERIDWLAAEKIGVPMMKRAIDTLFDKWGNGLPSKLGWQGPRPNLVLIESAKYLESIIRDIQSGHEITKKVCRDEYDPVEAAKMPNAGWHK